MDGDNSRRPPFGKEAVLLRIGVIFGAAAAVNCSESLVANGEYPASLPEGDDDDDDNNDASNEESNDDSGRGCGCGCGCGWSHLGTTTFDSGGVPDARSSDLRALLGIGAGAD
jgi:hypothetical protein